MNQLLAGLATLLPAVAAAWPAVASEPSSRSIDMDFQSCLATRSQVIAQLNVNPRDIIEIVNTGMLTVTRVCTSDGSVLITCSKEDRKMVVTQSPHSETVGCR